MVLLLFATFRSICIFYFSKFNLPREKTMKTLVTYKKSLGPFPANNDWSGIFSCNDVKRSNSAQWSLIVAKITLRNFLCQSFRANFYTSFCSHPIKYHDKLDVVWKPKSVRLENLSPRRYWQYKFTCRGSASNCNLRRKKQTRDKHY